MTLEFNNLFTADFCMSPNPIANAVNIRVHNWDGKPVQEGVGSFEWVCANGALETDAGSVPFTDACPEDPAARGSFKGCGNNGKATLSK